MKAADLPKPLEIEHADRPNQRPKPTLTTDAAAIKRFFARR